MMKGVQAVESEWGTGLLCILLGKVISGQVVRPCKSWDFPKLLKLKAVLTKSVSSQLRRAVRLWAALYDHHADTQQGFARAGVFVGLWADEVGTLFQPLI